jgi:hypothetical protein
MKGYLDFPFARCTRRDSYALLGIQHEVQRYRAAVSTTQWIVAGGEGGNFNRPIAVKNANVKRALIEDELIGAQALRERSPREGIAIQIRRTIVRLVGTYKRFWRQLRVKNGAIASSSYN